MDGIIKAFNNAISLIVAKIPNFLWAVLVLIIGWIIAYLISKAVSAVLKRSSLNKKVSGLVEEGKPEKSIKMEEWISKGVYYLLLLVVLVFFFHALQFGDASEPLKLLLNNIFEYIPHIISACVLMIAAWVIASLLRSIIVVVLGKCNLDTKVATEIERKEAKPVPLTKSLGDAVYWLIFLIFVPLVLEALELDKSLLEPINNMFAKVLAFLPQLIASALILLVGWFIARIVQRIVTNLLSSAEADKFSELIGLSTVIGKQKLSKTIGTVVYVLILIPVLIAALHQLNIDSISIPLSEMLKRVAVSAPNIFYAFVIIVIAYVFGRLVADLIKNLLTDFGINLIPARLGIGKEPQEGEMTFSEVIAKLVLAGIVFFAVIEACSQLGFDTLAELGKQFLLFAGDVILGIIIFGFGLFLANLASKLLQGKVGQSGFVTFFVRLCILIFAGAMALHRMGLANEIINMAFGLLLGAVAVAIAISFGIGGREFAARKLEEWESVIKSKKGEK
jgi:hypothetical protein